MYHRSATEDGNRNYTKWPPSREQVPHRQGDRLWVEISDDEESLCQMPPVFQSGNKHQSQVTPPLDLTVNEKAAGKPGRQAESPLDLSVKTRKRYADTTNMDEHQLRQAYAQAVGQFPVNPGEIVPSKRLRMTPESMQFSQDSIARMQSQYNYESSKQQSQDSVIRKKILQPQMSPVVSQKSPQLPAKKYPSSSPVQRQHTVSAQHHPGQQSLVQQYSTVQRQHLLSRSSRPSAMSQSQFEARPQTQTTPFENSQSQRSKNSTTSETVALQGFFEPTHKVTVNTSTHIPVTGYQHTMIPGMVMSQQEQIQQIAPTLQSMSNQPSPYPAVVRQMPMMGSQEDPSSQVQYPQPNQHCSVANIRSKPDQNSTLSQAQEYEMMQQKKIQQQRQLQQYQRQSREQMEKMRFQAQQHPMNSAGKMISQDQQRMMGMYKTMEQATQKRQFPSPQGVPNSLYPPTFTGSNLQSHSSHHSDQSFSGTRFIRAGQPEPLSDISQHSRTIEKAERIHTNPNPIPQTPTQRHAISERQAFQSEIKKHMMFENDRTVEAMERGLGAGHTLQTSGREHMYPMKEQNMHSVFADREQVACLAASMGFAPHPGVIQRPKGFIPPRVVSGSGRPTNQASSTVSRPPDRRLQTISPETAAENQRIVQNDLSYQQDISFKRHEAMSHMLHQPPPFMDEKSMRTKQLPSSGSKSISEDVRLHNKGGYQRDTSHMPQQQRLVREKYKPESVRGKSQTVLSNVMAGQSIARSSAINVHTPHSSSSNIQQTSPISSYYIQKSPINRESLVGSVPELTSSHRSSSASRSITKGTSGIHEQSKRKSQDDSSVVSFSQLVMRELKKTDDDISVNPFANRSLLQEYDRSATSSPIRLQESAAAEKLKQGTVTVSKDTVSNESKGNIPPSSDNSYTLPLQIAIPGHKQTVASSVPSESCETKATSLPKSETTVSNRTPRMMSRKHMILSAYKNEEDLKNTVNIDKDEKIPIESSKFTPKRHDRDAHSFPPSPKMPILSPQEKSRVTSVVSTSSSGEPPVLEGPSASSAVNSGSKPTKEINLLEEHLHRLISDAVKGSFNKDKESVYESVRRELTTQQPQGHKLFRQMSQTRNIPVANVAPIVQGKNLIHTKNVEKTEQKADSELDEDDKKMAELVTKSLFGKFSPTEEKHLKESVGSKAEDINESVRDSEGECSRSSFPGLPHDNIFDDTSNSKRMSPGIKKLMMFRQRDMRENNSTVEQSELISNDSKGLEASVESSGQNGSPKSSRSPREGDKTRNVFGAFSEILAQKCGSTSIGENTCWSGTLEGQEEHVIQLQPNTDYEGDTEEHKDQQKARSNPRSVIKRQASRLIRKARHRHKTGGAYRTRICISNNRRARHRRFVDFKPLVLTRRTRQKHKDKSPQRRKTRKKRRSKHDDESVVPELTATTTTPVVHPPQKSTRRRRASSVDRETVRARSGKGKSRLSYFSDNETETPEFVGSISDSEPITQTGVWQDEDESTDDEYFQNYEDELRSRVSRSATQSPTVQKKTPSVKKKKGFHFQQKYIFQRKRKTKGRIKPFELLDQPLDTLDAIYNFHEEGPESFPLPSVPSIPSIPNEHLPSPSNIPVPVEVKRVAVNKDTGETLLHRAARMGYEEVALYCLASGSVDVNARDNAGYTALHECAVRGGVNIAKHLLKYGADVNCCSVDGIRPIHDAVENDQLEMVRLLLSFGSDPTLSTYAGRTLMKIARTERMRNYLQAYMSDLNGYDSDSPGTPWTFVTSSPDLDYEDNKGCSIFSEAPSDPEDETEDLFLSSPKPLYNNCNLAIEFGKRKEDYILLADVLGSYNVAEDDLDSLCLPPHLIKQVPAQVLKDHFSDSVFCEALASNTDSVEAVRKADLPHVISRLERFSVSTKRSKS